MMKRTDNICNSMNEENKENLKNRMLKERGSFIRVCEKLQQNFSAFHLLAHLENDH